MEELAGGDVHRDHEGRLIALRGPVGRGVGAGGLCNLLVIEDIRLFAPLAQGGLR